MMRLSVGILATAFLAFGTLSAVLARPETGKDVAGNPTDTVMELDFSNWGDADIAMRGNCLPAGEKCSFFKTPCCEIGVFSCTAGICTKSGVHQKSFWGDG